MDGEGCIFSDDVSGVQESSDTEGKTRKYRYIQGQQTPGKRTHNNLLW